MSGKLSNIVNAPKASLFKGIRGRLFFAALVPMVAFTVILFTMKPAVQEMARISDDAYDRKLPGVLLLTDILEKRASIGYFLWAAIGTEGTEDQPRYINLSEVFIKQYEEGVNNYTNAKKSEEDKLAYVEILEKHKEFLGVANSVLAAIKKGGPEGIQEARKTLMPSTGPWDKIALEVFLKTKELRTTYEDEAMIDAEINKAVSKSSIRTMYISLGLGASLTFIVLFLIGIRLSNVVNLLVNKLKDLGSHVNDSIHQLTAAGLNLSHSSTDAAASLEETVASLEELTSMVQMNSDNAKQAATLSFASKESAEKGEAEIQHLVSSMNEISVASKKIEEIISVIDDIAFQTNLLALNASVEAARAGEHGKGFAVVADAVRTLAQRSATAAKDITVLIKDSVHKIEKGSEEAGRSGAVMSEITQSVKKVSDLANEISAASAEQTAGIQQISKAMNQLDQGSQGNAASAEEISATGDDISKQSQAMQDLVDDLSVTVIGGTKNKDSESLELETHGESKPTKKTVAKITKNEPVKNKGMSASAKARLSNVNQAAKPVATKAASVKESANVIPFDDDDRGSEVGDTSGF